MTTKRRYAEDTAVSAESSRGEIERLLVRYGANCFAYGWDDQGAGNRRAMVSFRKDNRMVRFILPMPKPGEREFTHTPSKGIPRSEADALAAWEQACRSRWRALALVVKAKLEAVEAGITTFEEEFLAHIVLPDGRSVGQWMLPQVESAYQTGKMPLLLPGLES